MRQGNVAVTPAGRGEAVRLPIVLVHQTVIIVATATRHWRHRYVNVTMAGWVTRVIYSVSMVRSNLLAVTTVCVTMVGRRLNVTWSVHSMDMLITTSASATLAGEGSCVISLDVLVSYCQV